jgi:hypothetical protein
MCGDGKYMISFLVTNKLQNTTNQKLNMAFKNSKWLIVKVCLGNCAWNNEYLIYKSQQCLLASMNQSIVLKWATFTFHSSMQKSTNLEQSGEDILKYVDVRCTVDDHLLFQKRLFKLLVLGCLHRHHWKSSLTMPRRNIPNKFTNLPSFWSDLPSMHTSFKNNNVWPELFTTIGSHIWVHTRQECAMKFIKLKAYDIGSSKASKSLILKSCTLQQFIDRNNMEWHE